MLLNSVILVLREVLEAAVLVSVLLALSRCLGQRLRWVGWALPMALLGSLWFAGSMDTLTDALGGAGQEVANATLQVMVFACTVVVIFIEGQWLPGRWPVMCAMMLAAVTLALVREGSEIWIYISGFAAAPEPRESVVAGSVIGAGIGVSLGILLYSTLMAMPADWRRATCLVLLALVGAGMVMQATMLLEQVDWLEAGRPLWDTSFLVNEASLTGELLYAVIGYEATPSVVQVVLYFASLAAAAAAWLCARLLRRHGSVG